MAFRSTRIARPIRARPRFCRHRAAITEFQVETNGFKPEFGQAAAAASRSHPKSGRKTCRVAGYGFCRHDCWTRKDSSRRPRASTKQSDVGGSLGGPLTIPNLYSGRNRTFFFVSYEGFYNKQGSNAAFRSVPTPEMWDGDFSNWVNASGQRITIYDPATTRTVNGVLVRDPFPNNRIPAERFSQTAKQYIALASSVLVPNKRGSGTFGYVNNNFASTGKSTSRQRTSTLRSTHANTPIGRVCVQPDGQCHQGGADGSGLPAPSAIFQKTRSTATCPCNVAWSARRWGTTYRRREHVQQERVFAERRSELQDKVCIRTRSTATRTRAPSPSPISARGVRRLQRTKQPRFTVRMT